MNNKKRGTEFEKAFCKLLSDDGYWVHFMTPDNRGAQPFDIIAVKDGDAFAIDCKTCVKPYIEISRLEDNQILAFEKWRACGNNHPLVAVFHEEKVYVVDYVDLKQKGKIKLDTEVEYV